MRFSEFSRFSTLDYVVGLKAGACAGISMADLVQQVILTAFPVVGNVGITGNLALTGELSATGTNRHIFAVEGESFVDNVVAIQNRSHTITGSGFTFVGDPATDVVTTSVNHGFATGSAFRVSSTSSLPLPLQTNTDYYAIVVSGTTLKLATTYQHAINGVAIDLTSAGAGVHSYSFISRGYSVIEFRRHNDPAPGCLAIGVNEGGFKLYQNRAFIATNTTDPDPTTPAPDIIIGQHQGASSEQHARVIFDGTNHVTRLYGWDPTNANALGPLALTIEESGAVSLNNALVAFPQDVFGTGALGAVSLDTLTTQVATIGGAATMTLAAATKYGQIKRVCLITDGGDLVVTVTNLRGGTTITFNDAGDFIELQYLGKWEVCANNGCVIA